MHLARSYSGVTVRLPSERWRHISQNHPEMTGFLNDVIATVEAPDEVRAGNNDARIAVREIEPGKALVVVYKETSIEDGFVITAFFTRERKLWP